MEEARRLEELAKKPVAPVKKQEVKKKPAAPPAVEEKPKRTRRTKTEMEAAKASVAPAVAKKPEVVAPPPNLSPAKQLLAVADILLGHMSEREQVVARKYASKREVPLNKSVALDILNMFSISTKLRTELTNA